MTEMAKYSSVSSPGIAGATGTTQYHSNTHSVDSDDGSSSESRMNLFKERVSLCSQTCRHSCSLQIQSTPYKSRIVTIEGYKINKTNRKYCSSVVLAIILIMIGCIGGVVNYININTGNVCRGSTEKVDQYLDDYRNITNYYYNLPVGERSKNITQHLYTTAQDKYSYKYSESQETKTISKDHLFLVIFKNNTNLTANCKSGSSLPCFNPATDQTYSCGDSLGDCTYVNQSAPLKQDGTKWPTPYQHSEADLLEKSKRDCTVEVCIDNDLAGILCTDYTFPCNVQLDTHGLFLDGNFDTSFSRNFSNIDYEKVSNAANALLWDIYQRAVFISSFYCVYMALMVFVGGPYIITSTRLKTKVQSGLNRLSKIWFIVILLFVWYASEILPLLWAMIVIDTDLFIILKLATIDPCFADTAFMSALFKGGSEICRDLERSEQLHDAAISNLIYYESVEETYQYYYYADDKYIENNPDDDIRYEYDSDDDKIFSKSDFILNERYNVSYDVNATECDISEMLDVIGPHDSSVNVGSFLLFTGSIAALLLQPILANLVKSIVVMVDPLAPYCGRVEMPYQHMDDFDDDDLDQEREEQRLQRYEEDEDLDQFQAEMLNEIATETTVERKRKKTDAEDHELERVMEHIVKWERTKNFCPLLCWTVLFVLIVINLMSAVVSA
eukprot:79647_1